MSHLTKSPISLDTLLAQVSAPERGGACVFVGTVRNAPEDGGVTAIEYAAYEEMADLELERIVHEARGRWPGAGVAVVHRLGRIPLGEASVAIAVATPHRADAFAACRFVIEEIKQRLPVWKKEYRCDGSTTWVEPPGTPGHRPAVSPPEPAKAK